MNYKYLCLFTLFIFFIHSGIASATTFFEPEWSEFCPPEYVNLNSNKNYFWAEKKYWLSRKADFENKKLYCNSLDALEKSKCWSELRTQETNKTNAFYAQQQSEQQRANSAILYNAIQQRK